MLHAMAPFWANLPFPHATQAAFHFLDTTCVFQPLRVRPHYSYNTVLIAASPGFHLLLLSTQMSLPLGDPSHIPFRSDAPSLGSTPTPPCTLSYPSHDIVLAIDFLVSPIH